VERFSTRGSRARKASDTSTAWISGRVVCMFQIHASLPVNTNPDIFPFGSGVVRPSTHSLIFLCVLSASSFCNNGQRTKVTNKSKMTRSISALLLTAFHTVAAALAGNRMPVSLQSQHPEFTPAEVLSKLSKDCERYGINVFDVYGDFGRSADDSFIRRMEEEIASDFGMEDAVFMPSGVMAQSIALLIHSASDGSSDDARPKVFGCHHSSHLLLHEQDAYRELLHLEPIIISTETQAMKNGLHVPAMAFKDVEKAFKEHLVDSRVTTLILELPHRELGGKLTAWEDVLLMSDYCKQQDIRFHCDGARIFEASAGYDKSLKELALPFDSLYISFYKGLGGISGAMLMGSTDFCKEARVWLRCFGGNLYTLLPYALSGWAGYQQNWRLENTGTLSFQEKTDKLVSLVASLSADDTIHKVVRFDPEIPETSMVHGYLRVSADACIKAADTATERCGIRVLHRAKDVLEHEPAYQAGFRSKFEWAIGEQNGSVEGVDYLAGWTEFAQEVTASHHLID
jgi:threonine aldolase